MIRFVASLWAVFAVVFLASVVHIRALEASALNDGQLTADAMMNVHAHIPDHFARAVSTRDFKQARSARGVAAATAQQSVVVAQAF